MGHKLNSSVLDELEYLANGNLIINYTNGSQYIYYSVPADVVMEFMAVDNPSRFYAERIRNVYRWILVAKLPPNVHDMFDHKYDKHRGKSSYAIVLASRPKKIWDVRAQLAAERAAPGYVKTQRQRDNERIAQHYRLKK
jgi:hypothetical protein